MQCDPAEVQHTYVRSTVREEEEEEKEEGRNMAPVIGAAVAAVAVEWAARLERLEYQFFESGRDLHDLHGIFSRHRLDMHSYRTAQYIFLSLKW